MKSDFGFDLDPENGEREKNTTVCRVVSETCPCCGLHTSLLNCHSHPGRNRDVPCPSGCTTTAFSFTNPENATPPIALDLAIILASGRHIEVRLPCGCWLRPCNEHGDKPVFHKIVAAIKEAT